MIEWVLALLLALGPGAPAAKGELDRVAAAVEGVESSWGADLAMWRRDPAGPQGPMQVSRAAALDVSTGSRVGVGNRFDLAENRAIGRAYLAAMFRRYGNWPDAVVAYNWGPANLDRWIAAGRPLEGLAAPIRLYLDRVMGQFRASAQFRPSAGGTAPGGGSPPPIVPVVIPRPDLPELKDPKLRKAFVRDAAEISRLQEFLAATQPAEAKAANLAQAPDTAAVVQAIRAIAERPGFEEFRAMPAARRQAPPSLAGLREIAFVLVGKLQQDSAALVLVDEERRRRPR